MQNDGDTARYSICVVVSVLITNLVTHAQAQMNFYLLKCIYSTLFSEQFLLF